MTEADSSRRRGRHTAAVVATLRELGSASPQAVFTLLRVRGNGIGRSTVYRELRGLAVGGLAIATRVGDEMVYALRGDDEIVGWLLCQVCGRRERLGPDATGMIARSLANAPALLSPRAPVVVQGVCRACVETGRERLRR